MDWMKIIELLGNGPAGIAVGALGYLYWRSVQRNEKLVDRIIELSSSQTEAMAELRIHLERMLR